MKTINVDLQLLEKYFSDHYDFKNNFGLYFSKSSYDLETDLHQSEYIDVYNQITETCRKFDLSENIDVFFNLFFISQSVLPKQNFKKCNEYSRQLAELFKMSTNLYNDRSAKLNDITFYHSLEKLPKSITVNDELLLNDIQAFIADKLADYLFHKKFTELNSIEYSELLTTVKTWLQWSKTENSKGAPDKSSMLKSFAQSIMHYIDSETALSSQLKTAKCEFVGILFEIYGLKKPTNQTGHAKMIQNILNSKD
jgi:hypothetical protein